ncbi:hypothetical protein ABZ619_39065 [Streptomyces sp. NPDC007851]|uniref:hypothetical protein n=1 Tax=Streptomyces sp. NPDC007851 TaxID=3155008 RepID=UPI0033C50518
MTIPDSPTEEEPQVMTTSGAAPGHGGSVRVTSDPVSGGVPAESGEVDVPRVTADPGGQGVVLHLPDFTSLDTQVWSVDIGLTPEAFQALREALLPPTAERGLVRSAAFREASQVVRGLDTDPNTQYASDELARMAECPACADGIEHTEHCRTPETHNWGCGCPTDRINLHAQSGIGTPGCDCGHEGMGLRWHGEARAWVTCPHKARQELTQDGGHTALKRAHVALAEQAGRDQAAIARVRQLHDRLAEETDLTSPDDPITRGAAAKRIATALDGWNPAGAPQCLVQFEGGGRCAKPAGHRPLGSDDPHVPQVGLGRPSTGATDAPSAELERGRAQLVEAMMAVSVERHGLWWVEGLDGSLYGEGGMWETLGRAYGWPVGGVGRAVWMSWEAAGAQYTGRAPADR